MMKNGYFLAGLLVLSGCSVTGMGTDKFKCGTHEDPRCASVFEAYENTHGDWKGSKTGKPQERQPGASLPASMPIMNAAVDETTPPASFEFGSRHGWTRMKPCIGQAMSLPRLPRENGLMASLIFVG